MKRPEYVAVVTGIYARLLEEGRGPTPAEEAELEQAFSRSGFTDAYWKGTHGRAMLGTRSPDTPEPKALFDAARAAYEKDTARTVPVRFTCRIAADVPSVLTAEDPDGHTVTVTGAVPEAARTRALTAESVEERLMKTGGTAYRCSEVTVTVDDGLSLSAGAINALRRDALFALSEARTAPPVRRELPVPPLPEDTCRADAPQFTLSLHRAEQLSDGLLACSPARISLPLDVLAHETALPQREGLIWCAELPRVWRDRDEDLLRRWLDHAASLGVTAALAGNLGHLPLLRETGLTVLGDYGLNVFNGRSLAYLKDKGLASACVSFELRFAQIRDMPKVLPAEAIVYGRLPLMITENCLVQNAAGCRRDREGPAVPADGPCRSQQLLRDRTGAAFPLLPAFGHRTEIQNSRPLWLADRPDFRRLGLAFARLRFTTESAAECAEIFRAYLEGRSATGDFTRGLYERGVE